MALSIHVPVPLSTVSFPVTPNEPSRVSPLINISTSTEDGTMSRISELAEPETQREVIRLALDELAIEIGIELRAAQGEP